MSEKAQEIAIADLKAAIAFFDKVNSASADERAAVGTDHWDWLESAARNVSAAFPSCTGFGDAAALQGRIDRHRKMLAEKYAG